MTQPDDDLTLHREISARERVDAILNAPHLSTNDAVAALDAQHRENQATFPHMVIATVMVEESFGSDREIPWRSYVGPFPDRRSAEAWGEKTWSDNSNVSWQCARIDTPELYEAQAKRMRAIAEGRDPDGD